MLRLWHERDISHSAVERVFGPDATIALDFALARLAGVIDKLIVYPEAMAKNLETYGGLVHSQRVLLALTQAGVSREDSYKLVQRNAMKVWLEGKDFLTELKSDPDVTAKLKPKDIEVCFDLGYHTKHVDTIFARVFKELSIQRLSRSRSKKRWRTPARIRSRMPTLNGSSAFSRAAPGTLWSICAPTGPAWRYHGSSAHRR